MLIDHLNEVVDHQLAMLIAYRPTMYQALCFTGESKGLAVLLNYNSFFSLTTVLLSHFLLNLRNAASPTQSTISTSLPDLTFVRPHDLGGTLIFNHDEDDDLVIDGSDDEDSGQYTDVQEEGSG